MPILICAATSVEYRAIRGAVRRSKQIHQIQVLKVGIGRKRAGKALEHELSRRTRMPELIISAGFAGSLTEQISVGRWVYAKTLCSPSSEKIPIVPPPSAWITKLNAIDADFLTTDTIQIPNQNPTATGSRAAQSAARLIDMESSALAEASEKFSVPFCVLRLVSDSPQAPLPGFVSDWTEALSGAKPKLARLSTAVRALKNTALNPQAILRLLKSGSKSVAELRRGWLLLSGGSSPA